MALSTHSTPTPHPPMRRRRFQRAAITLVVVTALLYAAVGWYVSGEIIAGLVSEPHVVEYDTDVLSVTADQIELRMPDESSVTADADAVMGLRWAGGYGQVGPAISSTPTTQVRPLQLLEGALPPVGEDVADFDSFAFPADPVASGVDVDLVTYPTELGPVEAWLLPGESTTWVVAVHGVGSDRPEFLRLIDAVGSHGFPMLIIRYRNSPDSPRTDDSLILMGQDEWVDVQAGVDYALSHGAAEVVVAGWSMGGAMALSYAMEETRDVVAGMILEAPGADLRETVAIRSGEALPIGGVVGDSLLMAGRFFTSLRTGLDFDAVDYVDRAEELDVPILLFHGTDDTSVPYTVGVSLADARPDLIEFHPVSDGAHVRAWNENPEDYARIVSDFLGRVAGS